MKTYPVLVLAAALCAGGCQSSQTAAAPAAPSNVAVNFHDPDNFTDVRDSMGSGTSQAYLDMISDYLKKTAGQSLSKGQQLTVTFNDIDLAGDIPPGRIDGVRIIKPIYIPRMSLTFQLKDASGAVIKEGERRLTDLDFQSRLALPVDRSDPLFYDKQLLKDWIRKEFPANS